MTEFARPEDGAWDRLDPRVFYFATTGAIIDGSAQSARLYRLTLNSLVDPTGGRIDLVVDSASLIGSDGESARGFDNIAVDDDGHALIQEDPGNTPYIAKTWKIDPSKTPGTSGFAVQILESDRERFAGTSPLTVDEESSGVLEVTGVVRAARWFEPGRRYYLGVMQAHHALPGELVEGGQLYLFSSPK